MENKTSLVKDLTNLTISEDQKSNQSLLMDFSNTFKGNTRSFKKRPAKKKS